MVPTKSLFNTEKSLQKKVGSPFAVCRTLVLSAATTQLPLESEEVHELRSTDTSPSGGSTGGGGAPDGLGTQSGFVVVVGLAVFGAVGGIVGGQFLVTVIAQEFECALQPQPPTNTGRT